MTIISVVNDHTQQAESVRLALLHKKNGQKMLTGVKPQNPLHCLNQVYQPESEMDGPNGTFRISTRSVGGNIDFRNRAVQPGEKVEMANGDVLEMLQ